MFYFNLKSNTRCILIGLYIFNINYLTIIIYVMNSNAMVAY